MARKKKVEVAAINVRVHPHPTGLYERFIRDVFALRRAVRLRGDTYMILGSLNPAGASQQEVLQGTMIKFTQIDPEAPWLDLDTFAEAAEDKISAVSIPDNLRPNMASMYFAFFPAQHLLIFERYSKGKVLSAHQVSTFLTQPFREERIRKKYGAVDISIVADSEGLSEILNIHALRSLMITIRRPNPDTLVGLTAEFQERLRRQNARQLQQKFDAVPGQSLEPDEETRQTAEVAARNGEVVASGRNENGITETRSTKDHPAIEAELYDPMSHRPSGLL